MVPQQVVTAACLCVRAGPSWHWQDQNASGIHGSYGQNSIHATLLQSYPGLR